MKTSGICRGLTVTEKIYFAVDYGSEGWSLTECDNFQEAFGKVTSGEAYGSKWKILREVEFDVSETNQQDG